MKKKILLLFVLLSVKVFSQNTRELDYIRLHARLAVEEMHLYKIPASITLAQGIIETGGGQSRLAETANNHFGIKCKKEWTGPTISHTDDAPNECFRKYASVHESYRDHSLFLAERPFYKDLFKLNMRDYKAWAHGLKKAGYATNSRYAPMLISKIEQHKLYEFDKLKPEEVQGKLIKLYGPTELVSLSHYSTETPKEIQYEEPIVIVQTSIHDRSSAPEYTSPETKPTPKTRLDPKKRVKRHKIGANYVIAEAGETVKSISKLYDLNPKYIAQYNEIQENTRLIPGQLVFFGRKKGKGIQKTYTVQSGDTMYLIAQKMGIRVRNLHNLNKIKVGDQPKVGTVLNLKVRKR